MRTLFIRQTVQRILAILLVGTMFLAYQSVAQADDIDDLVSNISRASLQDYLDNHLYTHDGDDRHYSSGPEHDLAQANIFDHFVAEGLDTYLDPFQYSSGTYYNVVGIHEGTTTPEQIYIIGAHYDSVGNPGADDDASGVAGVMEAARVLSDYAFDSTIIFIAFDVEERGMIGSDAYATKHANDDIRGMIEMDMIAFNLNQQNSGSIYGRDASSPIKSALADALQKYGGLSIDMHGYMDRSDHAPFEWQGFEACLLIEYDFGNNPHYHRQSDSVDTPNYIDYEYATKMAKAVTGCIAEGAGYIGPLEYSMLEPFPGVAGRSNTFYVTGATPDVRSFLVYSFNLGSTNVPNCPGLAVDMNNPKMFYRGFADAKGEITFERFTPEAAQGRTIYLQGVEAATCQTTNVLEFMFQ